MAKKTVKTVLMVALYHINGILDDEIANVQ